MCCERLGGSRASPLVHFVEDNVVAHRVFKGDHDEATREKLWDAVTEAVGIFERFAGLMSRPAEGQMQAAEGGEQKLDYVPG